MAFGRATDAAQQIRNFRMDRVARILYADTPVSLRAGVLSVIHVVPLQGSGQIEFDPLTYQMERHLPVMPVVSVWTSP